MSKKYLGKACAYCGAVANTVDHVFARAMFPIAQRANLIKVPACEACNGEKSRLEHYLSVVVPFGSADESIHEEFLPRFKSRLDKDRVLEREMAESMHTVTADGERSELYFTSLREGYLQQYAGWLIRGLMAHHFGLCGDFYIKSDIVPLEAIPLIDSMFMKLGDAMLVVEDAVPGVSYRGVVAKVNPSSSTWYVVIHGGIRLGDSRKPGKVIPVGFRAMTIAKGNFVFLEPRLFPWSGACPPLLVSPRMHEMALFFTLNPLSGASYGQAPCYRSVRLTRPSA
ncbi:HNH endonuclease [Xanthomonas sp. NCPPB 2632]|uniref:HNH endonuclease n=1 Tax=Xanthomonas sp. NCPPB 2632 TaxID=3240912 RepID=UPI003514DD1A